MSSPTTSQQSAIIVPKGMVYDPTAKNNYRPAKVSLFIPKKPRNPFKI